MNKINQPSTQAAAKDYDLCPSNSSKRLIEPVDEGIGEEERYYDMSGDKFLIILNQQTFMKTKHFESKPSTRHGTDKDVSRLEEVFPKFGFLVDVVTDSTYQNIIDRLTAFASKDHTRTSCILVTILTHGDKGEQIYAADKPYLLSEIKDIFEKKTLMNKPKMFFVQACRGDRTDTGYTMDLGSQSDSALTMPTYYSSEMPSCRSSPEEESLMMMQDPRQADSLFLQINKKMRLVFGSFRDLLKGSLGADRSARQSGSVLTVPKKADTLVLYSTVEGFVSYRHETNGTWMIQTLCDVIENRHEDLHLIELITETNRVVGHEKITPNNEKQILELSYTMVKLVKLTLIPGKA